MASLGSPVKQWGLLSWNNRWLTFEAGVISLYKSEEGSSLGTPIVQFDLNAPGVSVRETDASTLQLAAAPRPPARPPRDGPDLLPSRSSRRTRSTPSGSRSTTRSP